MRLEDKLAQPRVVVAWRPPFAVGRGLYRDTRAAGQSLLEIVHSVPDLPDWFLEDGTVCVNGAPFPRRCPATGVDLWANLRPKPVTPDGAINVTLHLAPKGGGGGGAKTVVSLVAAFALIVVTGGIAGGALAGTLGSNFAAGTIGARLLAGAVGLVGALAIAALTPPPSVAAQQQAASNNTDQAQPASASGNVLQAGGSIPRVVGTFKVYPPLIGEPIVELVDDDEYVEAAYALNGPHELTDIRIDGVAIDGADDVEYEALEGWADDDDMTLVTRQGITTTPQITMSTHTVGSSNQDQLADPSDPTEDLPVWHGLASNVSPDEIWVHLLLPNGISVNGSTSTDVGIPFRAQIRKKGSSSWTNLPEFHLSDSTLQQRRRALIFKFESAPDGASSVNPPQKSGFVYANIDVPGQTAAPSTSGWTADSYFTGSAGDDHLDSSNVGGSKVKNVALYANRVEVYLDPATFMPGIYEIQVMRGAAYLRSSFTDSSYQYGGTVYDLFTYSGTSNPVIPMSRSNLADVVQIVRSVSIWNEYPVKKKGVALIAIRARNRAVQNVSTVASGYVRDWGGSAWDTWTTTSNPSPHYADILSGAQNNYPLPIGLRDDTGLVAWRTLCTTNGWTCDAIIDDFRTQDALTLLASCGYAKSYQSEIYGVSVDSDRSSDDPVQMFSRRNATNVRFEKAFPRQPDGFIVTYFDKDNDYNQAQTTVYQRDRSMATTGLLEATTYNGLVDLDKVTARAQFDLDQADDRGTFYYLDADHESIVCRRGDLVALQHDMLTLQMGDALIRRKIFNSDGNIVAFELDSVIPTANEDDMHDVSNMHAITDMHQVGLKIGIAIRHNDGTISTHSLTDATGETDLIHLETAITATDAIVAQDEDATAASMLVAAKLNTEYLRLIVSSIEPQSDLKATLTLVDEAPELIRYAA